MDFKHWILLEADLSFQQAFDQISKVIASTPDFNSAVQSLVHQGMLSNSKFSRPYGNGIAKQFYAYLTGANKPPVNDSNVDQQLQAMAQKVGTLPGIKPLEHDATNPWHFFGTGNNTKSNHKIYSKLAQPQDILKVADFISKNLNLVRQFKFSFDSNDFVNRRDNMVIYPSAEGEKQVNNIQQQLQGLGINSFVGQDWAGQDRAGNPVKISGNESLSIKLAYQLLKKPGSPKNADDAFQNHQTAFLQSQPQPSAVAPQPVPTAAVSPQVQPQIQPQSQGVGLSGDYNTQLTRLRASGIDPIRDQWTRSEIMRGVKNKPLSAAGQAWFDKSMNHLTSR